MWLALHNSWCRVTRATSDELAWISRYLAFDDPKARFRWGKTKDQPVSHFDLRNRVFMSGFLPWVMRQARTDGIAVELQDHRPIVAAIPAAQAPTPVELAGVVDMTQAGPSQHAAASPAMGHPFAWLRSYQVEAVRAVLARKRGILKLPTAAGKTECFAALARAVPGRWLFVVDSLDLAKQAAERYELRTGEPAGLIGEGEWSEERVTCATYQTLSTRIALEKGDPRRAAAETFLGAVDCLCADECHTVAAATQQRVVQRCHRAGWRVGLSATPLDRSDQRSSTAVGAIGPVIHEVPGQLLRDLGMLSEAEVRVAPHAQRVEGETWTDCYRVGVEESDARNALLIEMARRCAKPAFLFVKGIDHGHRLCAGLRAAGLRAEFVFGAHESEERGAAIRQLEKGALDVLVCSVVFNKGIDVPGLRACINGAAGESVIATLQKIGRGMRVQRDAQGRATKTTFEVWDVLDKGCGCVEKHRREPGAEIHSGCRSLARHARKRVRSYCREGHAVTEVEVVVPRAGQRKLPLG